MNGQVAKKITNAFIILKAFESASIGWFIVTYVLFLTKNGLTLFEATQVNMAYMLLHSIVDPFTGSLADKVGQTRVYLAGLLVYAIGDVLYGFGNTYLVFVVAEIIVAVAASLKSEALEAWLRNNVEHAVAHKTIANTDAVSKVVAVFTALGGAYIGSTFGLEYPWFLSALTCFAGFLVGVAITRKLPDRAVEDGEEQKGSITESLKISARIPPLRFILAVSFVSAMAYQAFNMFWAPIFEEGGVDTMLLGGMWVGVSACSAIGAALVARLCKVEKLHVGFVILLTGLPMLIVSWFFSDAMLVLVGGFLLHEVGRGGRNPVLSTFSNYHISARIRSTTNSIRSSVNTFGAFVGLFLAGLLTEYMDAVSVWVVSGLVLVLLSGYIFIALGVEFVLSHIRQIRGQKS